MIILNILNFVVNLFKWIGLFIVLLFLCSYILKLVLERHFTFKQWILFALLVMYVVIFIFAANTLSVLWMMVIFISNIFADYEDKHCNKLKDGGSRRNLVFELSNV